MSEQRYIVGEKIDIKTFPNHTYVFPADTQPFEKIRAYGDATTATNSSALVFEATNVSTGETDTVSTSFNPIPNGGYKDGFTSMGEYFTDEWTDQKLKPYFYNETEEIYAPVIAPLYADPAVYVTDRIATLTIEGSAVIGFDAPSPVYGIYGENIKASLHEGFEDTDQGVYDTSNTGKATIAHYTQANRLYLKGTGTVTIWAGQSPLDDPFV